jgi:hypothetical protein
MNKVERKEINKICQCGQIFTLFLSTNEIKNKKYNKQFCSRKCANTRYISEATKIKISSGVKNSNKFIEQIAKIKFKCIRNKKDQILYPFICKACKIEGLSRKVTTKYHQNCWLKISGGIKPGTSRGKKGTYKGFKCDSSYELAFVIYCLEHDLKIKRNTEGFKYKFENKERKFYPDFILDDKYIEIKNYHSEITDAKIRNFPHNIEVYYTEDMKKYFDYVENKYGKNFIELYENGK